MSLVTWLVRGTILICVFAAGWIAANTRHQNQSKDELSHEAALTQKESGQVVVTVEPIAYQTVQRTVEALGTLYGFEEVSISSKIEGRVRQVFHDVSDRVKPTELLLEIEPTDYDLAVQQADRGLQVELAKLGLKAPPEQKPDLSKIPFVAKARSAVDHAKSRLDRITRLAASKNVSAEESETAAADFRTSSAEFDHQIIQAEAGLATIQMKFVDLQIAREKLTNTKIAVPMPSKPVPGIKETRYVVSQRLVSEGTLVRDGTEVFRLVIGEMLKLRVPVPERHGTDIAIDQAVEIFTASSAKRYSGKVTRIYPTVDLSTRTFQVEIQVPNSDSELKPGSFAKAEILTRVDPHAVVVPLSALVQFAGITKIFLVENGRARAVPVSLGTQTTEWVEIESPVLPEGTQIVTSGQMALANETPVVIRDSSKFAVATPTPSQKSTPTQKSEQHGAATDVKTGASE